MNHYIDGCMSAIKNWHNTIMSTMSRDQELFHSEYRKALYRELENYKKWVGRLDVV